MGIFGSKDNQPATDNAAAASALPAIPSAEPQAVAQPVAAPIIDTPSPAVALPSAPIAADNYIMTPAPEPTPQPIAPVEMSAPVISAPLVPADPTPVTPITVAEPTPDQPVPDPTPAIGVPDLSDLEGGDLSSLKQKALQELSPLVNHLDQSPEERFQTTMMMLQATDDQALIQKAYDTAQEITDEKTRAQALLDVINEINYFTQTKG